MLSDLEEADVKRAEYIFSALGNQTRFKILALITREELCACEIMAALELTQPTASHHLGILERSGLISSHRKGKWVFYRMANPKIKGLLSRGLEIAKEGA
jgi:ArsR family transcriptional regulator